MFIYSIIAVIYLLSLPLLQSAFGLLFLQQSYEIFKSNLKFADIDLACSFVAGLILHLFIAFFLKLLGWNWAFATFTPFLLLFLRPAVFAAILVKCKPVSSANFLLWFFIILTSGLTILEFNGTLYTAWANNYGDVAFHIGQITAFTFGENFPPQYHIYAGETLSYPFMINFWTALMWWLLPDFKFMPLIFLIQWLLLWLLVYRFVNGATYHLLPWVIFLGGGVYQLLGEYSYKSLNNGYPWVAFLGSIWVPQRTFLLGIVAMFFLLHLAYRGVNNQEGYFFAEANKNKFVRIILIGLFTGLGMLLHGHTMLATGLFIALVAFFSIIKVSLINQSWNYIVANWQSFILLTVTSVIGLSLCLPWLLSKTSAIDFMYGWLVNTTAENPTDRLMLSTKMWIKNASYCLILLLPFFISTKFLIEGLVIICLFCIFNFIKFAHWDWDQIKFFIALYCMATMFWSLYNTKLVKYLHWMGIVLIIPGAIEAFITFQAGSQHVVYSKENIMQAELVRKHTQPSSIIAAAPQHNSIITLTGRKLYTGYAGTTWTHGIDNKARESLLNNLVVLSKCHQQANELQRPCPDYLLWGQAEINKWGGKNLKDFGFEEVVPNLLYKPNAVEF